MTFLIALAAAAAAPSNSAPAVVGGLAGCWKVPGEVRGKDATSVARGEWHLGKRYFILHLRSVTPTLQYEAAILYGAGQKPGEIGSFWMDTFGGAYGTMGAGSVASDGFNVVYTYPDSVYTNRFARTGRDWVWTIIEKVPDKAERLFAEYRLSPTSCSGMKFDF
jgi:hypothetical protein